MQKSWLDGFTDGKRAQYGDKFDPSDLDPRFVPHISVGPRRRVQVEFPYGEIIWGYVSVTLGWRPTFLLMRRRGQIGSCLLLGPDCKILNYKDIK